MNHEDLAVFVASNTIYKSLCLLVGWLVGYTFAFSMQMAFTASAGQRYPHPPKLTSALKIVAILAILLRLSIFGQTKVEGPRVKDDRVLKN